MCDLCTMVPSGSIANDKCDVKNIYIQITASCKVQEAVLVIRTLKSL